MKGNSPPDQNENPVDPSDNHIQNLSFAERLHKIILKRNWGFEHTKLRVDREKFAGLKKYQS